MGGSQGGPLSLQALLLGPGESSSRWHWASPLSPFMHLKEQRSPCQISAEVGSLFPPRVFYVGSCVVSGWMRSFGLLNTKCGPGQLQARMGLGKLSPCEHRNICWEASFFMMERTHWPFLWQEEAFSPLKWFCAMPMISQEFLSISASVLLFSLRICLQELNIFSCSDLLRPDPWYL